MSHESENVEVWQYRVRHTFLYAWWCDCEPEGAGDGAYPTLVAALEGALAHAKGSAS